MRNQIPPKTFQTIANAAISSTRSATARGLHRDELAEAIIANVVADERS
jgi:hypothetical protein